MASTSDANIPRLNIIVTPKGLERVVIWGGVDLTLQAMDLYRSIVSHVVGMDEALRRRRKVNGRKAQDEEVHPL